MTQFNLLCSDVPSTRDARFVVPHRVLLKNVNAFSAHQLYSLYVDTKYAKCNVENGILAKLPDISRPQFHVPLLGALAW